MAAKQRMLHEIVVNEKYHIEPLLSRVAQRQLQRAKLESLEEALRDLAGNGMAAANKPIWWIVADIRDALLDIALVKTSYCEGAPVLTDQVIETFNPSLLTQMISHGAYSLEQFINAISSVEALIEQAAPLCVISFRGWWHPVKEQLVNGQMGTSEDFPILAIELLEALGEVKLELANIRLATLRPLIVDAAIEWEQSLVASTLADGSMPISKTIDAIRAAVGRLDVFKAKKTCGAIHAELLVMLLTSELPIPIPEVFFLDTDNILAWRSQLSRMLMLTSLWPVGLHILNGSDVVLSDKHKMLIRSTILHGHIECSTGESWAIEYFHLLGAVAAEQNKTIPSNCMTHLITAASPSGPLQQLLLSRMEDILRSSFGHGALDEAATARAAKSLSIVGAEFASVVEEAQATAAYLNVLYRPMYLPFADVTPCEAMPQLEQFVAAVPSEVFLQSTTACGRPPNQLLNTEQCSNADSDDEDEAVTCPAPTRAFQLSAPGLQPLSYSRVNHGRARSCDPTVLEGPFRDAEIRRQNTLDTTLLMLHRQSSTDRPIRR